MLYLRTRIIIVAVLLVAPAAVLAQETGGGDRLDWDRIEQSGTFSTFFENDVLLTTGNEDRNYTMGFALQWSGRIVDRYYLNRPRIWVDALLRVNELHDRDRSDRPLSREQFQIGVSAFTPEELRETDPQPDDRPYASILYLVSKHQSVKSDLRSALTSELSIGALGLGIADWFQTRLHEHMQDFPGDTPYTPQGWHLQVSEGGEPTARYALKRQALLACSDNFDLQWTAEGHIGYYTNASVGGALRIGKVSSPWWSFSSEPIVESKIFGFTPQASESPCGNSDGSSSELYLWAGGSARVWVYNALLQGQFRHSEVTISSSEMERLVGEYQLGVTGTLRIGRFLHSLTYAYARRSPEIDTPLRRSHSWGGLYYNFTRSF